MKHFIYYALLSFATLLNVEVMAQERIRPIPNAQKTFELNTPYYLYNVGRGMFVNKGEAWGTQATLSHQGMKYEVRHDADMPDGYYYLYSDETGKNYKVMFRTNSDSNAGHGVCATYVDNNKGDNAYWTIQPFNDNVTGGFIIQIPEDTKGSYPFVATQAWGAQWDHWGKFFDSNGITNGIFFDVEIAANPDNVTWQFVTEDDYATYQDGLDTEAIDAWNAANDLKDCIVLAKLRGADDVSYAEQLYNDIETQSFILRDAIADLKPWVDAQKAAVKLQAAIDQAKEYDIDVTEALAVLDNIESTAAKINAETEKLNAILSSIPIAQVSVLYCGRIPSLNFECSEGMSVVSFDATTLGKDVGEYRIPMTFLVDETTVKGYAIVNITKKPLTVTAYDKKREYGEANPELTIVYDGFVAGESVADLLTPPHAKTAADTSSPAGKYDITVDGAISNNYEIIYQKGTLTVSKAPLSIVVNNTTKEYGEANPTFTCTYHGLKNGESYPAWSTAPTYQTDATATSGVGVYSVSLVNGEAKNYEINNRTDGVLTITPASLTVTAKDVTRQYGDENPAFTFSYAGFKGSDNENTLSSKPQGATSTNKKSDVGDYAITVSGASSPNYAITHKNGVLHVTQTPLTIKPYDVNRLYGENNPTFTFSYTGFKNGESEAVLDTKPTASAPGKDASVGTYTIQASGATAKNYAITHVNGTLTIGKAPLVATANNSTRTYGEANPTFMATYSGFVNGDTEASLTSKPSLTTPATRYSDVGSYDIVPTGGSAKNYYFSEYRNGTLTITPASLLVKANNQQRLFYEENPTLTYTCIGFKNSDNNSVFTKQPQLECGATMISNAGEYPITIGGAASKNYTLEYENATLTVKKRTLQVTPADATRKYGEVNPVFSCTLQGFVRNQNESVITEMPEIYTTATSTSDVGRYDILSRGGSAMNYDFNYSKKGVLTIEKADQSIVWEQDLSRIVVGDQVELQAYATSGLDIEYVFDTDIASIYRVGSKRYLDCYGIGSFAIRATQSGNNNYEAAVRVSKTVVIDSATGVDNMVETLGNGEPFDVYDLNGRKVRYKATSLKGLPKGVYVVNGQKVVK